MSKPAFSIKKLQKANKSIPKNRAMVVKKPGDKKPKRTYMLPKQKKYNMLPRIVQKM